MCQVLVPEAQLGYRNPLRNSQLHRAARSARRQSLASCLDREALMIRLLKIIGSWRWSPGPQRPFTPLPYRQMSPAAQISLLARRHLRRPSASRSCRPDGTTASRLRAHRITPAQRPRPTPRPQCHPSPTTRRRHRAGRLSIHCWHRRISLSPITRIGTGTSHQRGLPAVMRLHLRQAGYGLTKTWIVEPEDIGEIDWTWSLLADAGNLLTPTDLCGSVMQAAEGIASQPMSI